MTVIKWVVFVEAATLFVTDPPVIVSAAVCNYASDAESQTDYSIVMISKREAS
ncbi:hypothetical protein [Paenibacillus sp. yr247]|uniref:hypothetical protein n=1 Tax=Paenibacillus sp. yr247 TaxID=1761880 RepID=UPI001587EF80|nr:hypothetical protein [Paenibacillus sp. yr247]